MIFEIIHKVIPMATQRSLLFDEGMKSLNKKKETFQEFSNMNSYFLLTELSVCGLQTFYSQMAQLGRLL